MKKLMPKIKKALDKCLRAKELRPEHYDHLIRLHAAAFKSTTNVANADKICETLKTSLTSRFGNRGKLMILSYTRHHGDFIERKYEESLEYDFILGDTGTTWGDQARRKREDFADDYKRDAITAVAKYECIPPLTVNAFLDPEKIDKCITGRKPIDPMGHEKKTPGIIAMDACMQFSVSRRMEMFNARTI